MCLFGLQDPEISENNNHENENADQATDSTTPPPQPPPSEEDKPQAQLNNWLPITASRKAKWWYSAFHNVTAMVGAGVLGLPYAMSQLGWYHAVSSSSSDHHFIARFSTARAFFLLKRLATGIGFWIYLRRFVIFF